MNRRAILLFAIALTFGVLAVASVALFERGASAIASSDAALAKSDLPTAIAAARRAAEAAAPGSPYPERGYRRLETIAKDAEARSDDETARAAWSAMRAAATETRGPLTRTGDWLERANAGIARAGSHGRAGDVARTPAEAEAYEQLLLRELHRDETPPTLTFALLAGGAIAFFGGLFWLAWRSGSRLALDEVRTPAIVAALGLAAYLFATLR